MSPTATPPITRVLPRIVYLPNGCQMYMGSKAGGGYGVVGSMDRRVQAHRVTYEHFRGPIPDGMQIDHLCRNRWCVAPEHLEAVTPMENVRRGGTSQAACPKGHPYTPDNMYWRKSRYGKECKTCAMVRVALRSGGSCNAPYARVVDGAVVADPESDAWWTYYLNDEPPHEPDFDDGTAYLHHDYEYEADRAADAYERDIGSNYDDR